LSELVADGELDAEFIPVESEHSAISACVGSSAAGARTFTATSSQGLALMHEILFIAPVLR
ncbi:MAG: pyruvate ferredoxin oxidoreductase, partial [Anaerolineae bacterium]|nr:pyruvate ferredoxin oxidoreductase [Anaerolineae bacterium]